MKRVLTVSACTVLLLAACGKVEEGGGSASTASAPTASEAGGDHAKAAEAAQALLPKLAYRYRYEMQVPSAQISGLMSDHERACLRAGPSVCQVTGQSVRDLGGGDIRGALSLRAVPAWLDAFRDGLAQQAEIAHGKLTSNTTETEDLTTRMVDTEAAIRAKVALRDRLQTLVAHHDGKLADLLEIENQLAQVQGEIDAARSSRAVMGRQVAMSELAIDYTSAPAIAAARTWNPVTSAVQDAGGILVVAAGWTIRLLAVFAIPGLVGVGLWAGLRPRRPRKTAGTA